MSLLKTIRESPATRYVTIATVMSMPAALTGCGSDKPKTNLNDYVNKEFAKPAVVDPSAPEYVYSNQEKSVTLEQLAHGKHTYTHVTRLKDDMIYRVSFDFGATKNHPNDLYLELVNTETDSIINSAHVHVANTGLTANQWAIALDTYFKENEQQLEDADLDHGDLKSKAKDIATGVRKESIKLYQTENPQDSTSTGKGKGKSNTSASDKGWIERGVDAFLGIFYVNK